MKYNFNEPELGLRASLGFVKDVYDPVVRVREPLAEYQTMLDLIRRDPHIATAFDILVDFSTYRGHDFIGGSKEQRTKAREKFDKLNWHPVDRNLKYSSLGYGDAYLELRDTANSGTIDELHPLETTEMRIAYDQHGEVKGYVQRPFKLTGLTREQILDKEASQGVPFTPEQVIHYRTKWMGSQVYSYNPMEAASTSISTKLYASNYLMNIFINMPPQYLIHLAGASKLQRTDLKNDLLSGKTNYKKSIAVSSSIDTQSKIQLQKIEPAYNKDLLDVIRYVRREILMLTRVPQSWIEESAGENRGITEAEQRPFDVKIHSFQKDPYEIQNNKLLLPALGFRTKGTNAKEMIKFKYNTISWKGEKEILENAGLLRNMGLKQDALVKYLDNRGILGLDPTDFEKDQLQKSMELNKSRQRMDKSTDDMKINLDEKGVSDAGEAKAKEVAMRSAQQFTQFPYKY